MSVSVCVCLCVVVFLVVICFRVCSVGVIVACISDFEVIGNLLSPVPPNTYIPTPKFFMPSKFFPFRLSLGDFCPRQILGGLARS